MEAKLVPQAGYKLKTIKIAGFQRKISLENKKRNASTRGLRHIIIINSRGNLAHEIFYLANKKRALSKSFY